MKIGLSDRAGQNGDDVQPMATPDVAKVELFQAALNARPSNGDGTESSEDDVLGPQGGVGQVLTRIRRGAATMSNDWHQAGALASDLGQRRRLDSSFISDTLKLQEKIVPVDIKLYLCTKIAGKCTHTLDILSRG